MQHVLPIPLTQEYLDSVVDWQNTKEVKSKAEVLGLDPKDTPLPNLNSDRVSLSAALRFAVHLLCFASVLPTEF